MKQKDTRGEPVELEFRSAGLSRRSLLLAGSAIVAGAAVGKVARAQPAFALDGARPTFRRIRTQFIAALAGPSETSGDNAQRWGLWRRDPGPRGVRLEHYDRLLAAGNTAPAGWQFDPAGWWLEEHGLIMEQPEFPLPPGRYLVTGNREVTTVLTVDPADRDGRQRWALADEATIYDVTHLRCRSARYRPLPGGGSCSPANAEQSAFPVAPGSEMPRVEGCEKQDYAVLLVIGMAVAA